MELFDNRYELLDLIGCGSFSKVWKVLDTETNVIQALKIYSPDKGISNDGIEMLKHEYALLNDATHPNLLRPSFFMFSGKSGVPPYLILTYCEKGNVSKLIRQLDEHDLWVLIRDTASALAYLHSKNPPIIHQDIKPENILISNDGIYQLTDFGISIQAKSDGQQDTEGQMLSAGTISYMAPERFRPDSMPIKASDVYSLGVMLFELASGYLPFGNNGGLAQLKENAEIPDIPWNYSPLLKDTIKSCLHSKPWERPLASKLEEIAKTALAEEPQPVVPTAPPPPVVPRNEAPARRQIPVRKIAIGAIVAIMVIVAGVIGWHVIAPQDSSEQVSEVMSDQPITKEPTPTDPIVTEPIVTDSEDAEPVTEEPEPDPAPAPVVEPEQDAPVKETIIEEYTPKTKQSKPRVEKTGNSTLDLGYAVWKGGCQNGKPHGPGTMTFKTAHRIDSRDPQRNIAQSGDRVEGNYVDGHLEYGTWIRGNGESIQIFIGQ